MRRIICLVVMEDFFGRAERALLAGDYEHARALLVNLVAVNPQHDAAWLLLARLTDDSQQREECYARALAINPRNRAFVAGMRASNGTSVAAIATATGKDALDLKAEWSEAQEAFALAQQALKLALVATGHQPEDSIPLREASTAGQNWTVPTDVYSAAIELYDQALRLVPGSRTFMDERKAVALKLERVLITNAAETVTKPNDTAPTNAQFLSQAETLARRLYTSYGIRQTEAQQEEMLRLGNQMLDCLDAAQAFDARVTRARVTTSVIFTLALEVFLDLATQALAKSTRSGDIMHWAEDRARALDYLLRLEQAGDRAQAELENSDGVKAQAIMSAVQARKAFAQGGDVSRQMKLRASELIEFADALIPLLSGDGRGPSLAFGQRILQVLDEVLGLDPARTRKWLRTSGHAALQKYHRALERRLLGLNGDPSQKEEIVEVEKRLAVWLNI